MSEAVTVAASAALATATQNPTYSNTNGGPILVKVVWILLTISAIVIFARLYTKLRKTHRLYWDDVLITLAWVFGCVHASQITWAVHYGLGRHMLSLTAEQREQVLRIGAWSLLCGFLSPMAGRVGFGVTILCLAGTDSRVKKWPIWLFIAGQFIVNISAVIVFYSQCGSDVGLVWSAMAHPENAAKYHAKCLNRMSLSAKLQTDYGYFQGSFNTLTDVFLTALPAILIGHTKLSKKTKIGLACLLCLSVLAMIASIVKTYEARALSEIIDYTHDLCAYVIWISIELNVVMIGSSIPLVRPLFVRSGRRRAAQQKLQKWDRSTLGSFMSRKGPRANLSRVDSAERIMSQCPIPMENLEESGIQVTREVMITYENTDRPFVHAALVGLVDGGIANPNLIPR
ncbi:hypothetical protein B0A55_07756 [Friedmanniomyces simplex]|uniref:Rhodopsin domain-containing protein n=1 Tax=Friedmanniomyces simplex TaxID=329884 RepID=A0A4V5NG34_9PEZI|nr:hypothetical protein B0A55_07756 [Friedmanniomyces simplex]